jgi:hypothetical protein
MAKSQLPGRSWRFQAWGVQGRARHPPIRHASTDHVGPTEFDELVVGDWFHMEQMDHRDWWMRVGPAVINIHIHPDGTQDMTIAEEATDELLFRWRRSRHSATYAGETDDDQ